MNRRLNIYHITSWFDSLWWCRNACATTKDREAQSKERGWELNEDETWKGFSTLRSSLTYMICVRDLCTVFSFCFSRKGKQSVCMGRESWQTLAWSEAWLWRGIWYRLVCRFSAVVAHISASTYCFLSKISEITSIFNYSLEKKGKLHRK